MSTNIDRRGHEHRVAKKSPCFWIADMPSIVRANSPAAPWKKRFINHGAIKIPMTQKGFGRALPKPGEKHANALLITDIFITKLFYKHRFFGPGRWINAQDNQHGRKQRYDV